MGRGEEGGQGPPARTRTPPRVSLTSGHHDKKGSSTVKGTCDSFIAKTEQEGSGGADRHCHVYLLRSRLQGLRATHGPHTSTSPSGRSSRRNLTPWRGPRPGRTPWSPSWSLALRLGVP